MIDVFHELVKSVITFLRGKLNQYNVSLPYVILFVMAFIFVVGGINLFVELTENLSTEMLANYDHKISQYLIDNRSPSLTKYLLFVTHVGDAYGYLIVLIIVFFISLMAFKSWKYVVQITLVLMLSAVSNLILKRFIDRARPDIEHMVSVETLSYPSGHAMSAMAFYGFLMYLFYKFNINKFIKYTVIAILAALILSIGISRIYLGVHFPSDIAGGYIAGAIWVVFCVLIFKMIELFRIDLKA